MYEGNIDGLYRQIFDALVDTFENYEYPVFVKTRAPDNLASQTFPLVVVEMVDEQFRSETLDHCDPFFDLKFSINIYTQDQPVRGNMVDRTVIARQVKSSVDYTLDGPSNRPTAIRMKKTSAQPLPNVDAGVCRYQMRYQCRFRPQSGVFYKM